MKSPYATSYNTNFHSLSYCFQDIADYWTNFQSASALLAMQTTVIARGILSVHPSVTFWCFVHMNKDTIMQFSASGWTIILVSGEVKFIQIFAGDHPQQRR